MILILQIFICATQVPHISYSHYHEYFLNDLKEEIQVRMQSHESVDISHAKTLAREIEYELSVTFPSNCKFSSSLARPFIGYCLVPKVSTIRPYPTSSPIITSFSTIPPKPLDKLPFQIWLQVIRLPLPSNHHHLPIQTNHATFAILHTMKYKIYKPRAFVFGVNNLTHLFINVLINPYTWWRWCWYREFGCSRCFDRWLSCNQYHRFPFYPIETSIIFRQWYFTSEDYKIFQENWLYYSGLDGR